MIDDSPVTRIDKWLWAARLFKTRSLAIEACRAGHVKVDGTAAKAARNVRCGETITVRSNDIVRTLRVTGLAEKRVGPKVAAQLYEDLTPPEEWERRKQSMAARILSRSRGGGRPTKRERRKMDEWLP